jgi:hypothetical protein
MILFQFLFDKWLLLSLSAVPTLERLTEPDCRADLESDEDPEVALVSDGHAVAPRPEP